MLFQHQHYWVQYLLLSFRCNRRCRVIEHQLLCVSYGPSYHWQNVAHVWIWLKPVMVTNMVSIVVMVGTKSSLPTINEPRQWCYHWDKHMVASTWSWHWDGTGAYWREFNDSLPFVLLILSITLQWITKDGPSICHFDPIAIVVIHFIQPLIVTPPNVRFILVCKILPKYHSFHLCRHCGFNFWLMVDINTATTRRSIWVAIISPS